MTRVLPIAFALLAGSALLTAQNANQGLAVAGTVTLDGKPIQQRFDLQTLRILSSLNCPVAMSAKQSGAGSLIAVKRGQAPEKGFAQHIRLSATNKDSAQVIAARVTVHGLMARSRIVPANSGVYGTSDISRSLDITFSDEGTNEAGADLALRGFTAVLFIDVDSVTFADGSTWNSRAGACRITPDPLMLISAR